MWNDTEQGIDLLVHLWLCQPNYKLRSGLACRNRDWSTAAFICCLLEALAGNWIKCRN